MMRYLAAGGWIFLASVSTGVAQEPDYAAALGTPGVAWAAPESGGRKASVVAAADAQGGSLVVIPAGNVVQVPVAQERFVKVRFRNGNARVRVDDTDAQARPFTASPENAGTQWMTYTYVMPKPGLLTIGNYGGENQVDTVTFIEPAGTLAGQVGLPEGTLTTGGAAAWVVAPVPESDEYGAKIRLTEEAQSGWMELPVTGPAEVRVDYRTVGSPPTLRLSSGGKLRWDSAVDDLYGNHVVLELPAGQHVVRLEAGFSRYASGPNRTAELAVSGIAVTPLEAAKILPAMDDEAEPWTSSGSWKVNHGPIRDGVDSLSAEGTGYGSRHKLRRTIAGPGIVSFWTFVGPVANGSVSFSWSTAFQDRVSRSSSDGNNGWVKTSMWVPPGDHGILWEVDGTAEQFSHMALDALEFTPSPGLDLAAASGLQQTEWSMDGASPWRGVLRTGDGPLVVSPFVTVGAIAPLSTTVNGPGVVSFKWAQKGMQNSRGAYWIDGKQQAEYWGLGTYPVEVIIPKDGPVELSWGGQGSSEWMGWFELSEVTWTPLPEIPLAEALDAVGTTWTTSPAKPFKGRPDAGAVNGSAAQVGLLPGGEAWLEAKVEGSGLFDFWLRDVPGTPFGQSRDLEWDLYVDGVKAVKAWNPSFWPAKWILGDGTHHLRLHFRNTRSTGDELFVGVDQVSWVPQPAADLPEGWTRDGVVPPRYFTSGGRNGAPQFVIPVSAEPDSQRIERTFTGPGVLTWDSQASHGLDYHHASPAVFIDGKWAMTVPKSHDWRTYRLHLPAGEHEVRWYIGYIEGEEPPGEGGIFDAIWQVSGVNFTPGVTDLMKGVDQEGLVWLAIGDAAGTLQAREDAVDGDVWIPGMETELYLCNLETEGLRLQGRMDALREPSEPSDWERYYHWMAPGGWTHWSYRPGYGFGSGGGPAWIDGVTVERVEMTSVEEGLDLSAGQQVQAIDWEGIRSATESLDGVDCAWARVVGYYEPHTITMDLPAASRVKFRWKKTGSGALGVRLDGAWLPLPEPTGEWSEAEFETGGAAVVQWALVGGTDSNQTNPGEAWLDGVEISPAPAKTLAEVLAPAGGMQFSQTPGVAENRLWKPVAYPVDGTWRTGARVISDAAELEATVTGPVNLSFNVWCGAQGIPVPVPPAPGSSGQVAAASGVIVVVPGSMVTERYLMVSLDGTWVQRINRDAGGGWTEHVLHVPAGEHRVSWQLGRTVSSGYGQGVPEWQAVLGPITLTSPRQHYDAWATPALGDHEASAPAEDADGDGVSNFHEYAFGTDPRDPASVPAGITGRMVPPRIVWGQISSGADYELRVPRLRPHVQGVLQESTDLVNWTPATVSLRTQTLLGDGTFIFSGDDMDEGIYQVMRFRGPSSLGASPARFYRVVVPMPE